MGSRPGSLEQRASPMNLSRDPLGDRSVHIPDVVELNGRRLLVPSQDEFATQRRQFFDEEILSGIQPPAAGEPVLVDCGANVGVCVLWFKTQFPNARVVAFEPDPIIAGCLAHNVACFDLSSVEIIEAAAWTVDGTMTFASDGVCGSRLALSSVPAQRGMSATRVRTVDLLTHLPDRITLLKLDVEGAELDLLRRCAGMLRERVSYLHVEVHEFVGTPRRLPSVLQLLAEVGFDYHLAPLHTDAHPYRCREAWRGIFNPMAVFAWAPQHAPPIVETAT